MALWGDCSGCAATWGSAVTAVAAVLVVPVLLAAWLYVRHLLPRGKVQGTGDTHID